MALPAHKFMRYRVLSDTEHLRKGDILVQHEKYPDLYCTQNVCTTLRTIELHPETFEILHE